MYSIINIKLILLSKETEHCQLCQRPLCDFPASSPSPLEEMLLLLLFFLPLLQSFAKQFYINSIMKCLFLCVLLFFLSLMFIKFNHVVFGIICSFSLLYGISLYNYTIIYLSDSPVHGCLGCSQFGILGILLLIQYVSQHVHEFSQKWNCGSCGLI